MRDALYWRRQRARHKARAEKARVCNADIRALGYVKVISNGDNYVVSPFQWLVPSLLDLMRQIDGWRR